MLIKFGAPVYGIAGKELGEVDGVVVNAGTKRVRAILVESGLFGRTKRMVAISAIERSDDAGLHLDSTGATAAAQSPLLGSEEVAFQQRVEPPTTFIESAGVGGPVIADTPAVPGEYPDDSSFFDLAPLDPPPVEIESNLEENEVILGRGAEVFSSDNHELGKVASLDAGGMGLVGGVTLAEGFLGRSESTFNLDAIDEFGTDAVHLRLSRAELEAK
jgi:hypothetical protein